MLNGVILGILTFAGTAVLIGKAPTIILRVLFWSKFLVDLLFTVFTYVVLASISGSFAAALGAATAGILFSIWSSRKCKKLYPGRTEEEDD